MVPGWIWSFFFCNRVAVASSEVYCEVYHVNVSVIVSRIAAEMVYI